MSKWSSDKRRGAKHETQPAEGVAEAFMARPDTGVDGPLDPLDRRLGGVDPALGRVRVALDGQDPDVEVGGVRLAQDLDVLVEVAPGVVEHELVEARRLRGGEGTARGKRQRAGDGQQAVAP